MEGSAPDSQMKTTEGMYEHDHMYKSQGRFINIWELSYLPKCMTRTIPFLTRNLQIARHSLLGELGYPNHDLINTLLTCLVSPQSAMGIVP